MQQYASFILLCEFRSVSNPAIKLEEIPSLFSSLVAGSSCSSRSLNWREFLASNRINQKDNDVSVISDLSLARKLNTMSLNIAEHTALKSCEIATSEKSKRKQKYKQIFHKQQQQQQLAQKLLKREDCQQQKRQEEYAKHELEATKGIWKSNEIMLYYSSGHSIRRDGDSNGGSSSCKLPSSLFRKRLSLQ
jgi:tRNA U34 5-carboxymethylaminomethyl modifying enzyme MnmG/GidA